MPSFMMLFIVIIGLGWISCMKMKLAARTAIMNTISLLNTVNNDIPNSMIIPFFFQGKANEIVRVFKKAPPEEKRQAQEMLVKMDITNANLYKQELK